MWYLCPRCGQKYRVKPPSGTCPQCDTALVAESESHDQDRSDELPPSKRRPL